MEANTHKAILGGGFLIKNSSPEETFIPEDFSDEQKNDRADVR